MFLSELKVGDPVIINQHTYHYLGKKNHEGKPHYAFYLEWKDETWVKYLLTGVRDVEKKELIKTKDGIYEWETHKTQKKRGE